MAAKQSVATDPKIIKRLEDQPPVEEPKEEKAPKDAPKEEKVEKKEEVEEVKEKKEETKEEKTKKRTKEQFEKLKKSNKALKEEVERKNVLESLVPEQRIPTEEPRYPDPPTTKAVPTTKQFPQLTQAEITETFKGLVDDAGYVDTGLLINTLKDLQDKNKLSEERAQQAEARTTQVVRKFDDFERKEIMRRVHSKYPKLNPEKEEFDERLWEGVRNEVIGQWTSGKREDVMAAAKKWSKILYGGTMKKKDKEKLEKAETDKRNINALGVKQTTQRVDTDEHEALVKATQQGKRGALAERLKKAGQ